MENSIVIISIVVIIVITLLAIIMGIIYRFIKSTIDINAKYKIAVEKRIEELRKKEEELTINKKML